MVQNVERFFKAAIVDKNTAIASAALVSSYHLYPVSKDVIKRWVNEAQEAVHAKPPAFPSSSSGFSSSSFSSAGLNISTAGGYLGFGSSAPATPQTPTIPSTSYITQYHALGLLYAIRQQDRMAVTKMIQGFGTKGGSGGTLKNPMAICMLIRYASKVIEEDPKYTSLIFHHDIKLMISFTAFRSQCLTFLNPTSVTNQTW